MPLSFAMSLMSAAEFLLWAITRFSFLDKGIASSLPRDEYLSCVAGRFDARSAGPALTSRRSLGGMVTSRCISSAYWAVYIASAITLFFICVEVFRSVLSSFTGLMRLGTVVFRWAALVSSIVSLTSVSFTHRGVLIIPDIAYGLMRSVSILELCLLAFLCLSMNALRCSVRDMAFGIALGFGLMSSNDFVVASLMARNTSLTAPLQFLYEALILVSLGIWVAYCALPEPVRKPVVMPANSTIYRWNEIASALGHRNPGCRAAAGQQLLPDRRGEGGGEGAEPESEGPGVGVVDGMGTGRSETGNSKEATAMRVAFLCWILNCATRLLRARPRQSARGCRGR